MPDPTPKEGLPAYLSTPAKGDVIVVFGRRSRACLWPFALPPLWGGTIGGRISAPFTLRDAQLFTGPRTMVHVPDREETAVDGYVQGTFDPGHKPPARAVELRWNRDRKRFVWGDTGAAADIQVGSIWFGTEGAVARRA